MSRWVQGTGIAGTVFIGVSAFWLSYRSLTHLAQMSGIADAWLWPLIVDGIIVVATVSAVALAGRRGAWYPWLLLVCGAVVSVTANAIQAAMADVEVPHAMAAAVASVPPIVLLAITHLTVVLTRPHTDEPQPEPPTVTPPLLTSVLPAAEQERTTPSSSQQTSIPPFVPGLPTARQSWPAPPTASPPPWTPVPPPGPTLTRQGPAPVPEEEPAAEEAEADMSEDALVALLEGIRRETASEPPLVADEPVRESSRTSLMEQAAALKAEGLSNKEIGQRLGVDPTTVGRWLRQLANGAPNA